MMHKISRKKTVEGTRIPGFIRNGQYFYINVDVYEDGMINCWELVDIAGLEGKLDINWLQPQVPVDENISIFGLGYYKVESAVWKYDKMSYLQYIKEKIKQMNPELSNLYVVTDAEKERLEKRRIAYSPRPKEFYVKSELGYQTVEGGSFTVFFNHQDHNYLVNLVVYEDGTITIYHSDFTIQQRVEDMEALFDDGTLFTSCDAPTRIILDNFGEVTLTDAGYSVDGKEKLKELMDLYKEMNGEETTLEVCRNLYYQYLQYPDEDTKAALKVAYEAIPEHERVYLGDMDSRDTDYIRILYTDETREV
nr:hypothetical protein [Paenibacillus sp. OSY-SE]